MALDTMYGTEIYNAIDRKDSFYHIIMRNSDISSTAVAAEAGCFERRVTPRSLNNALATFNRMVTQTLRPLEVFASSYFYDIF